VQWLTNVEMLVRDCRHLTLNLHLIFYYRHEEDIIMLKREFINWLEKFYSEQPTTFRIFWFLIGWAIGSSIKIAYYQHRLNKR